MDDELSFRLQALNTTPDTDTYDDTGDTGTGTGAVAGAGSRSVPSYDATAVFYVKLSDMRAVFQFQTPSADASLNDAIFDSSSNIRYYVFRRLWPTSLKINPSHAMMDRTESDGACIGTTGTGTGTGTDNDTYSTDKSLVKHDFIRYIALQLFNTVRGVDLFQNESDLLENIAYYGEVARVGIQSVLDTVSSMSADITMNLDSSGNRYSTNDNTSITNISRELMRQIATSAPSRLEDAGVVEAAAAGSLQSVPLLENDTLNIKVTMEAAPGQNALTNVGAIPSRSYNIKLILKGSVVDASGTNTAVSDSALFPNAYPYASNVLDLPVGTATASAIAADGSPPVPIPVIRYGYQGWYYTNSDWWVSGSPSVRNKINWYLGPNTSAATVGDLRYIRLCLRVFNRVSTPFLTVYTKTTGSGDAGGWYKSKRTYVISDSDTTGTLTNNNSYCFYMCWNGYSVAPFVVGHTNVVLTLTEVGGGAVGGFGAGETILAYCIGTNSSSARGNVEFILSNVVVGEISGGGGGGGVIEHEYGFIPA